MFFCFFFGGRGGGGSLSLSLTLSLSIFSRLRCQNYRARHQGKGLTSEPHEAAIRAVTPRALLSPEEQEEQQKTMGAIKNAASPAKGPKGKREKSTERGKKRSKSIVKPSVEVG